MALGRNGVCMCVCVCVCVRVFVYVCVSVEGDTYIRIITAYKALSVVSEGSAYFAPNKDQ